MTRSHRAVGDTVEDKVEDKVGDGRQSQINVVTRSHRAVRHTVETQCKTKWGTKWETQWETKPDPCRDKISQSSERHSGRHSGEQSWRQSQIHVVTRSHRAVGDKVDKKWGAKPDPCRDKILQSSGRHSGRQSQIHVVTPWDPRSYKLTKGRHIDGEKVASYLPTQTLMEEFEGRITDSGQPVTDQIIPFGKIRGAWVQDSDMKWFRLIVPSGPEQLICMVHRPWRYAGRDQVCGKR